MEPRYELTTALKWREAEPEQVAAWQVALLQDHLTQAGRAPFYQRRFKELSFRPADITDLEDLSSLPLTSRADIDRDPTAFQAVPAASFTDIALTSGTTGTPLMIPYTTRDLERLAFNEQMAFWGTGARATDRFLLCVTLDRCFIAGLAYFAGLSRLGAAVIRSGPGQPARQWELIRQLRPSGIVGVPTFLLKLAEWGQEHGHDPKAASITSLVAIGEPTRTADGSLTSLGAELVRAWGANLFSTYAATEVATAFCECEAACGGHVHPELALVEIVDEKGTHCAAGEAGEVVVTPLGVEGFPLVRFRTGDIARLQTSLCACGWQTPRLGPIEGRLAQRLKFRGTTLYPEMIFQALQEHPQVDACYVEVRAPYDLADEVTVVAGSEAVDAQAAEIADFLQNRLRVRPEVVVKRRAEVIQTMERAGGRKPKRFFDLRKKDGL